ncbi:TPA: hypothetical protein HA265_05285, partial [Candidatus Woesearchaeota archaeon]|nr:hypothetical protein [Candidatus Woesearchaeota archaeon]
MVKLEELKILEKVPSGKEFRLHDGDTIESVVGLYHILQRLDPEVFSFHVTGDKNDFGNWIRGVQRDYLLANALAPGMTQEDCLNTVAKRIYDLRKATEEVDRSFHRKMIRGMDSERPSKTKKEVKETVKTMTEQQEDEGLSRIVETIKIDDPETAEMKIRITEDGSGELALPEGGEELVAVAEDKGADVKGRLKSIKKAKDIVDVKEFASDMKKVFTVTSKKNDRKRKIDELREVCDYGRE